MGKGLGREGENGKDMGLAVCLEIFNGVSKNNTVMVLLFLLSSVLGLAYFYHCLQVSGLYICGSTTMWRTTKVVSFRI